MTFRRPRSWIQWLRRVCQVGFLLLFVWLVLQMRLANPESPSPGLGVWFDFDPLVALATFIATYTFTAGMLFALITVVATLLLGRVFCGWVCPLGTIHNIAGWLFHTRRAPDLPPQRRSIWQRGKYVVLIALLLMSAFGVHWVGVLDPLSLLYRTTATVLIPAAQYGVEDASTAIYRKDPALGPFHVTSATEPVYEFFRDHIFVLERQAFWGATFIGFLFTIIVALNFVRPRFWCRYICPLGGLLGVLAQRPAMRLRNDESQCNDCGKCNTVCPAAAQPDVRGDWLPTECYGCWNCVAACNFNSISFEFEQPWQKKNHGALDLSKRAALTAGATGLAGVFLFRLTPQTQVKAFNPGLIRPPGARPEREFLQRCIQCGACMRACPTAGLQPTLLEAGLEGIWTPKLLPKTGYCEYNCNLCGQICPTEAIAPMPLEEKQEVKLGVATVDRTRCLPYAYGRECIVCEEHCPVPEKAIYFVEREVELRDGNTKILKQPEVDPDLCIGCGICEWSCPWMDRAAIRVTSANETRHPDNQPILPSLDGGDGSPYGF